MMQRGFALLAAVLVVLGGIGLWFLHMEQTPASAHHEPLVTEQASTIQVAAVSTTTPVIATAIAAKAEETTSTTSTAPKMRFEIVTTQAAQNRGLGGRASIPDNYAMLFVFPTDDLYGFWMKDMLVPIDMIWLADNGTIIKIDDSVSADTYPQSFYPPAPVKYVLETKAGFAREHGWSIGTKVSLPLPY